MRPLCHLQQPHFQQGQVCHCQNSNKISRSGSNAFAGSHHSLVVVGGFTYNFFETYYFDIENKPWEYTTWYETARRTEVLRLDPDNTDIVCQDWSRLPLWSRSENPTEHSLYGGAAGLLPDNSILWCGGAWRFDGIIYGDCYKVSNESTRWLTRMSENRSFSGSIMLNDQRTMLVTG